MGVTSPNKKFLLAIMFILLEYNCYGSVVTDAARNVELESQLKILNKTPVKTIQMGVRDVFECIDINKQPSLDHPFLKNHVIKTKPVPHSINTTVNDDHKHVSSLSASSSSYVKSSKNIAILRKLSCPYGTVPIRRTSKEDLIKAKLFSQSQLVHSNNVRERDNLENPSEGQFFSIAKTRKDSGIDYMGIAATISINNPSVTIDQSTTAQMWIENGSEEEFNSLQAGWIVAPSLFGDNRTRLFNKWEVSGTHKSEGCYNTLCPGFIQVDQAHPIGISIGPISRYATTMQYTIRVSISQDGGGNWWLYLEDIKIGYWPAELGFSQLTQGSSIIAWGGLATQIGGVKTTVPPTGNGYFPLPQAYYNIDKECYMKSMKVMPTKTQNWEDPTRKIIDTFATKKTCSDIKYFGHLRYFGHILAFGGPGGNCL